MKITDEMVEDAAKAIYECDVQPGDWVWSKVRDRHRLALGRAALEAALLTDDGAADTPPADKGVRCAPAAESATPAPTGAAAPSSPHLTELLASTVFHCFDHEEFGLSAKHAAAVSDALVSAGLFGEGATPAIDRGALSKVFNILDAYERQGMASASDFDKGAQRAAVDIHNALLNALGGAQ